MSYNPCYIMLECHIIILAEEKKRTGREEGKTHLALFWAIQDCFNALYSKLILRALCLQNEGGGGGGPPPPPPPRVFQPCKGALKHIVSLKPVTRGLCLQMGVRGLRPPNPPTPPGDLNRASFLKVREFPWVSLVETHHAIGTCCRYMLIQNRQRV